MSMCSLVGIIGVKIFIANAVCENHGAPLLQIELDNTQDYQKRYNFQH